MWQLHTAIYRGDKGKHMKMACSSPPLLDDREDREEVDHCLVSIPRGCRVSPPELATTASASIELIASLTSWSLSGDGPPPLASVASSAWLNWAIFLARASWVSSSSCLMSSMVRPYHSSCQHQACRWARTITFLSPGEKPWQKNEPSPTLHLKILLVKRINIWLFTHQHHEWSVQSWTACPSNGTPPYRVCRHTWWGSCLGCCCTLLSSHPAEDPFGSWLTCKALGLPQLCTHEEGWDLSLCQLGLQEKINFQKVKTYEARCFESITWKLLLRPYYVMMCAEAGWGCRWTCMGLYLTAWNSFYSWNFSWQNLSATHKWVINYIKLQCCEWVTAYPKTHSFQGIVFTGKTCF